MLSQNEVPAQKPAPVSPEITEEAFEFVRQMNANVGIFSWYDDREWVVVMR